MTEHTEHEQVETPVSISRIVHILKAYTPAIFLSLAAVAVGYLIVAIFLYLVAPSQRITTQPFHLDFNGANEGTYPNGTKFASSEITNAQVLLKVFQDNELERFTTFEEFSRSVFVLEANAEYDKLANEYQAKLSDPKLSPMDRDRIQREWEAKSVSVNKSGYSINYLRTSKNANLPESLVRKVLVDVLNDWASYAIHEQRVLSYRLSILSPELISPTSDDDYIVSLQILRSKIRRVLKNIEDLDYVPVAELARTPSKKLSLEEIKVRLEEILRYRIEPLIGLVRSNGLIPDPAATVRFLESNLAYDQRELQAQQNRAEGIRQSLAVYAGEQRPAADLAETTTVVSTTKPPRAASETVMPQISDTFLDRLVTLTAQSADVSFRQKLVEDFRRASLAIIPAQQAVAYDEQVLALVRNSPSGTPSAKDSELVRKEIHETQAEVRDLVGSVNELYGVISKMLVPSTELFSLTEPPATHTERTRSLPRLALYGVLTMVVSLPIIVVGCFIHARVREEEAEDEAENVGDELTA